MPYRRTYRRRYAPRRTYGRRRRYGRRNGYRAGRTMAYGQMALGAWNLAKKVAYLANTEVKYDDTTLDEFVPTSGALTVLLNGISQGDTEITRDGMSVKQLSVDIKLTFNVNPEQLEASSVIRFAIIHDKQSDGTPPTVTDWLANADVNSFRNLYNGKRFNVLMDRRFQLNNDSKDTYLLQRHIPFVKHIRFGGTTDGAASINTNGLYLIVFSSGTSSPYITGYSRVRYVDN